MGISREWIMQEIENIAAIGRGKQGITRLAYTEQDAQARAYIINKMQEVGLVVRIDQAGNIIGRMEGSNSLAPAVVTGSHLDTVPEGGKYDGVVGVVGGLAAISRLRERLPLSCPVELIVFAGEESSRFGFASVGSKSMAGLSNVHAWQKAKDAEGISFMEAATRWNLSLADFPAAVRTKDEIKAFVELHIEQSDSLENERATIGIVENIAAPTRFKMTVEGIAAHSGATSMEMRRDALVSAAMIVLAIEEIALEQTGRGTVATVGAMKVHPGAINVIPGKVEMWVDVRGIHHESVIECLQEIKDAVSTIAEGQETAVSIEMLVSEKPVAMHENIIAIAEDICRNKKISYRRINSGAGHDAMYMAKFTPTGMLFIPCKGGLSHNPEEYADAQDMLEGIEVLTEVLYQLAK